MKKALLSLLLVLAALPMAMAQQVVVDDTIMCAPLKWRNGITFTRDTAVVLTTDTAIYVLTYTRPKFDTTAMRNKPTEVQGECVANYNGKVWTRPGTFIDTTLVINGTSKKCVTSRVHITLATTDSIDTIAACGHYTAPWGETFNAPTQTHIDTTVTHGECTYVKHLTLTVTPEYALHDVQVTAGCSYKWGNRTITDLKQYTDTLPTVTYGCDSIVRLQVTSYTGSQYDTSVVVACDSVEAADYFILWDTVMHNSGIYNNDGVYGTYATSATSTGNCHHYNTLDVTIVNSMRDTQSVVVQQIDAACSYKWDNYTFEKLKDTTVYRMFHTAVGNCDSLAGVHVRSYSGNLYDTTVAEVCATKYNWKNNAFRGQPGYNNNKGYEFTSDTVANVSVNDTTMKCITNYTLELSFVTRHDTITRRQCGTSYTYSGYLVRDSEGNYNAGTPITFDTNGLYSVNADGDSLFTLSSGCYTSHTLNVILKHPAIIGSAEDSTIIDTCGKKFVYELGGIPYTFEQSVDTTIVLEDNSFAGCSKTTGTLSLTLRKPTAKLYTVAACDSYHWDVNNTTYTATPTKTVEVLADQKNAAGCDSTLELKLTINYTPVVNIEGDWVLNPHESTVLRAVPNMAISNYAWYVNGQLRGQGQKLDSLVLNDVTGNIDVNLRSTSTKNCTANNWLTVTANVGIDDVDLLQANIYPTPTARYLNIESAEPMSQVVIFNSVGQQVLSRNTEGNSLVLDLGQMATGSYTLRIMGVDGKQSIRKFIINK